MAARRKRIVLYYPQMADPSGGEPAPKDHLPLSLLTIAAWPDRDGYEVVLIDGNLHSEEEGHRRAVEACAGALLFGTTGILGYQVGDAFRCARRVRAAHPRLTTVLGGWFASVTPELQLATGLYDAVALGQGELTFRELVRAVDCGAALDTVAGLALWRDGAVLRTAPRAVVGWSELLDCPWHLIDVAPYRDAQLGHRPAREIERMPTPPGHRDRPFFGISYYSSFGCPEPCAFCCSPEVSGLRWKCMPAERMLDDLCGLRERWGFDAVRFYDANWGVMEKRSKAFSEGLLARGVHFWWYCLMQSSSVVRYAPSTLDAMRDSGLYVAQLGGETGDAQMMRRIGKHTRAGDNVRAARELSVRGVCSWLTYIIGYPGEEAASMLATIDEARQVTAAAPLARANVWPYRPIPGSSLYEPSLALGFRPPHSVEDWAEVGAYHMREPWPGQIPPEVARARKLYEHYSTLALGLARGRIGWWERRARERLSSGDTRFALLEARAFGLCERLRRLGPHGPEAPDAIRPGHHTSVLSGRAPL